MAAASICWYQIVVVGSVLIVERDDRKREILARDFRCAGALPRSICCAAGMGTTPHPQPEIVIVNVELRDRNLRQAVQGLREVLPGAPLLAGLRQDAIVLVNSVHRAGFDGLVRLPVTRESLGCIIKRLYGRGVCQQDDGEGKRFSLSRARWERMARAVHESSSLTKAAARLGLEPRSLRRMLGKDPPSR